ncbi:MAG: ATP-dependent helicase, partial [Conexivisphaera sp.]
FTTEGKYVGDLEEAFVEYLAPGDLFVLGGRVYEYLGSKGLKVLVRRADGARPTVPSWFSEMLPLAFDSALLVGRFRRAVADKLARDGFEEAVRFVAKEYNLDEDAARSIVEYVWEQYSYTGGLIPSDKLILIEVFDEEDRRNVIAHSLFGRRANDALSRAYAYIVSRAVGANVKITVTDNGFMLTLPGHPSADWVGLFKSINPDELYDILVRVLRRTELLKRRFRHVATRSFMLLRRYRDVERSIQKLQVNAEELLKAVEEIENFPVLKETYREILEDYMHIDEARKVLEWVREGEVEVRLFGPVDVPSPFAHSIVVHGYSDVVLMEDIRRMLAILYDQVMEKLKKLGVQLQVGGV